MKKSIFLSLVLTLSINYFTFAQINSKLLRTNNQTIIQRTGNTQTYQNYENSSNSKKQQPTILTQNYLWSMDTIVNYKRSDKDEEIVDRDINTFNKSLQITESLKQFQYEEKWYNVDRFVFTYDSQNNQMIEQTYQIWNENKWISRFGYIYTYDQSGNMLTSLLRNWVNNQWLNTDIFIYTFDNHNNLLETLCQVWNKTTSAWENYDRIRNTYDDRDNLLTVIPEIWYNKTWIGAQNGNVKETYTYDDRNNILTSNFQDFINNTWTDKERYIYTYDLKNNQLTSNYQAFANGNWDETTTLKYTYTYDDNNNKITEISQKWIKSYDSPGFVGDNYKKTFIYDNQNRLLSSTIEIMDEEREFWKNSTQAVYTYDKNGNTLSEFQNNWDFGINNWVKSFVRLSEYDSNNNKITDESLNYYDDIPLEGIKMIRTYDPNSNILSEQAQNFAKGKWTNDHLCKYEYDEFDNAILGESFDWRSESWIPDWAGFMILNYNNMKTRYIAEDYTYKAIASYTKEGTITGIEKPNDKTLNEQISIFPNPTTGIINITTNGCKVKNISVFNNTGQQILLQQVNDKLNITALANGTYIIKISTDKGVITKKILKK